VSYVNLCMVYHLLITHAYFDIVERGNRPMAEIGPGPHRSREIAKVLGKSVTAVGLTRARLIAKGMIWSPDHSDTAFFVPLVDAFMKRITPDDERRT
jgi:hypothetical protein